MAKLSNLEQIERKIQSSVKFIDVMLREVKRENEELRKILGMSYGKYIGLSSPFVETMRALKKVKSEFDLYLETARKDLASEYKSFRDSKRKKERVQTRH